jgi:hypothetical protein
MANQLSDAGTWSVRRVECINRLPYPARNGRKSHDVLGVAQVPTNRRAYLFRIAATVILSLENLIFCFELMFDRWPRHDSIEFLHRCADSGRDAAAAGTIAASAAKVIDHAQDHHDGEDDQHEHAKKQPIDELKVGHSTDIKLVSRLIRAPEVGRSVRCLLSVEVRDGSI